jgi:hypothetical protein
MFEPVAWTEYSSTNVFHPNSFSWWNSLIVKVQEFICRLRCTSRISLQISVTLALKELPFLHLKFRRQTQTRLLNGCSVSFGQVYTKEHNCLTKQRSQATVEYLQHSWLRNGIYWQSDAGSASRGCFAAVHKMITIYRIANRSHILLRLLITAVIVPNCWFLWFFAVCLSCWWLLTL